MYSILPRETRVRTRTPHGIATVSLGAHQFDQETGAVTYLGTYVVRPFIVYGVRVRESAILAIVQRGAE
jgi:hypothetical protein